MRIFGQIVIIFLSIWALLNPLEECLKAVDRIRSIEFSDSIYFLICCLILIITIRQFTREVPLKVWIIAIILLLYFSAIGIYFDIINRLEIPEIHHYNNPNFLDKFVYHHHSWLAKYWRVLLTLIITSVGINAITETQFRKNILKPE